MKQWWMRVALAITLSTLSGCALMGCGGAATNGAALGACQVGTRF